MSRNSVSVTPHSAGPRIGRSSSRFFSMRPSHLVIDGGEPPLLKITVWLGNKAADKYRLAPLFGRADVGKIPHGHRWDLPSPRQRRHPSATANRLSRHHFREISACASHQRLRPLRGNPPSFPGKSPVPRKGPRSTPPGHAAACISENAGASKRQLVSRLSKERRARQTADGRHAHHACG